MKLFKVNGRRIAAKTIADAVEAYKANKEGDCKDASGVDFDYLLAEERKAVNDYRTAISQTTDAKLLTVLSHILKEETEHIEELEAARKGEFTADAVGESYENEKYKGEWKETLALWEQYKRKNPSRKNYDIVEYANGDPGLDGRRTIMTKKGPDRPGVRGHADVRKMLKELLAGKDRFYSDSVRDANYLRTPRGTFKISNESEEMLRHKGWGMWFEHENDGKFYRIMHDPKTQSAVAVFVRNV